MTLPQGTLPQQGVDKGQGASCKDGDECTKEHISFCATVQAYRSLCPKLCGLCTTQMPSRSATALPAAASECQEGFDEVSPGDHFVCTSHRHCIPQAWVCDAMEDCSKGEDEKDCPTTSSTTTTTTTPTTRVTITTTTTSTTSRATVRTRLLFFEQLDVKTADLAMLEAQTRNALASLGVVAWATAPVMFNGASATILLDTQDARMIPELRGLAQLIYLSYQKERAKETNVFSVVPITSATTTTPAPTTIKPTITTTTTTTPTAPGTTPTIGMSTTKTMVTTTTTTTATTNATTTTTSVTTTTAMATSTTMTTTTVFREVEDIDDSNFKDTFRRWLADQKSTEHTFGPISAWNIFHVTDMAKLCVDEWNVRLPGATTFNDAVANWDVSHVVTMSAMFFKATSFNRDVSK